MCHKYTGRDPCACQWLDGYHSLTKGSLSKLRPLISSGWQSFTMFKTDTMASEEQRRATTWKNMAAMAVLPREADTPRRAHSGAATADARQPPRWPLLSMVRP